MKLCRLVLCLLTVCVAVQVRGESYDAVCEITNLTPERSGGFPGGSAALVGVAKGRGLLVSAGHVFDNGGRTAKVRFPTVKGEWRARMLRCSQQPDIAVLEIENPPNVATPPCVRVARREDGPFVCAGFPWNGRGKLHFSKGEWLGCERGRLTVRCRVISGYSGGAVFNRYGEYVGNVCGMTSDGRPQMDRMYGYAGEVLQQYVGPYQEVKE